MDPNDIVEGFAGHDTVEELDEIYCEDSQFDVELGGDFTVVNKVSE